MVGRGRWWWLVAMEGVGGSRVACTMYWYLSFNLFGACRSIASTSWLLRYGHFIAVASEAGAGRGRCEARAGSKRDIEDVLQMRRSLERDVVPYWTDRVGFASTEERGDLGISYLILLRFSFSPQKDAACGSWIYLRLSRDSPLLSSHVHSDLPYQISHRQRECKKR